MTSLWIGGLSSTILLLRKEDNKWNMYWDMIKRFSPWATCAVIVILITGLFNSTFLFQQSTRYLIRSMD